MIRLIDVDQKLHHLTFDSGLNDIIPGSFVRLKSGYIVRIPHSNEGRSPYVQFERDRVESLIETTPFFRENRMIMKYFPKGEYNECYEGSPCRASNLRSHWDSLIAEIIPISEPNKGLLQAFSDIGYRDENSRIVTGDRAVAILTNIYMHFKAQAPWQRAMWCDLADLPYQPYKQLKIHQARSARGELYNPTAENVRVSIKGSQPSFQLPCEVHTVINKVSYAIFSGSRSACIAFMWRCHGRTLELRDPISNRTIERSGSNLKLAVIQPSLVALRNRQRKAS